MISGEHAHSNTDSGMNTDGFSENELLGSERARFRLAGVECTQRGLWQSAKWANEQLATLSRSNSLSRITSARQTDIHAQSDDVDVILDSMAKYAWDRGMTWEQRDVYSCALSLFNLRDFEGTAQSLLQFHDHPTIAFLRMYSLYIIACRKISTQRRLAIEKPVPQGDELPATAEEEDISPMAKLYAQLEACQTLVNGDPFLLYLKGIVADKLQFTDVAASCLVQSLLAYPYNWSAWVDLTNIVKSDKEENVLNQAMRVLPECLAKRLYFVWSLEYFPKDKILQELSALNLIFNESTYLSLQKASLLYNHNEYELCARIFEIVFNKNPFLLDKSDEYANVLYVLNDRPKLSLLAQRCSKIDKYRPESCIVIGNYYSLRGDHVKAITYFRRAIKLDSCNSLPWTLLGHEYIELKNRHAAVEAYRCAIDLCPRDFRAWFALGNVYKLIRLPYYAIYYFKRAVALRPRDPRFWVALGECYAGLERRSEAAGCYKRALGVSGASTGVGTVMNEDGAAEASEPERVAVMQLARLYFKEGVEGTSEHYYKLAFYHYYRGDQMHSNAVEAALFLARKKMATGHLSEAETIAELIIDSEDGRALMREINDCRNK